MTVLDAMDISVPVYMGEEGKLLQSRQTEDQGVYFHKLQVHI